MKLKTCADVVIYLFSHKYQALSIEMKQWKKILPIKEKLAKIGPFGIWHIKDEDLDQKRFVCFFDSVRLPVLVKQGYMDTNAPEKNMEEYAQLNVLFATT